MSINQLLFHFLKPKQQQQSIPFKVKHVPDLIGYPGLFQNLFPPTRVSQITIATTHHHGSD